MNEKHDDDQTSTRSLEGTGHASPRPATESTAPPNGGLQAWLKVLGCFLVFFTTWGIGSSFGAYQSFYELNYLSTYSASTISWIGTMQVFLLGMTGILWGALFDRGYIRSLLIGGCCLTIFGLFMLSLSREFYQIMLSQGVCIGLGNGMIYVPSVAVVANTFSSKRPIAIGLAATGAAVGGVVLPIMFRRLVPTIGFGWVNRIFGFLILGLSVAIIILLKPNPRQPKRTGRLLDPSALREPPYLFLLSGLFFSYLGYWIPLFYIVPYAETYLHTSSNYAFYLLAIMNAGSFAGRVLPAYLSQTRLFSAATVLAAGAFCLGVLILCWTAIHTSAAVTVWSCLVGFMSGITVAMPNAVTPKLSPSPAVVGARTGMMWFVVAFAALIGSPIAGALVDTTTNNYAHGQIFGGASVLLGAALLVVPAVHVERLRRKNGS